MPDQALHACAYRVVRYTPNLVRDEWVNIGVLIHDPTAKRTQVRLIEELGEFARIRRLHPNADERFLRALQADFEAQLDARQQNWDAYNAELDRTLSNLVQLSPQTGVLTDDMDAELDRFYHERVAPQRYRGVAAEDGAGRPRRRVHLSGRPIAARLLLSPQRYPRLCARPGAFPRPRSGQGAGVHGRIHPGEAHQCGVCRGNGNRAAARQYDPRVCRPVTRGAGH